MKRFFFVKRFLRSAAPFAAMLAIAACSAGGSSSSVPGTAGQQPLAQGQSRAESGFQGAPNMRRACGDVPRGFMRCGVQYAVGLNPDVPSGLGATDLETAYNLPSSTNGAGQTVAVVDAYDNPNAVANAAVYASTYGLPAPNVLKYNQTGQQSNYPRGDTGWGLEEALDIDMMIAGCPQCKILLVEGNSNSNANLEAAVAEAAKLGATVISNSYSGGGSNKSAYNIPGVTILASAGDSGYGIADPADIPTVVSVGGTHLVKGGGSRGWTETVWNGTGSGCANSSDAKPSWEKAKWTPGCNNRVANDVSAVATGVTLYDTYGYGGFVTVAGTSISSPLVGSIFALAGNATTQNGGKTFWMKKHHQFLFDITSGSNGSCTPAYLCTAEVGYDGPTGWGTPNGIGAF
jgi:subtilase family serine protease